MDRTRRSLCGLAISSVPLAAIAPRLVSAAKGEDRATDPLLAYLAAETRRHCHAASRPGPGRAVHVRGLAANMGMLTAYLHSRVPIPQIETGFRQQVQQEGVAALTERVREAWPGCAQRIASEIGVSMPIDLETGAVVQAIDNLERYGCPRLGGVSRWIEAEADRMERLEGRGASAVSIRQTPGSDFGPPGWAAGSGDPGFALGCGDLNILIAALGVLAACQPESAVVLVQIAAILNFVMSIACNQ